jgi:hypothetical protein
MYFYLIALVALLVVVMPVNIQLSKIEQLSAFQLSAVSNQLSAVSRES